VAAAAGEPFSPLSTKNDWTTPTTAGGEGGGHGSPQHRADDERLRVRKYSLD